MKDKLMSTDKVQFHHSQTSWPLTYCTLYVQYFIAFPVAVPPCKRFKGEHWL